MRLYHSQKPVFLIIQSSFTQTVCRYV